MRSAFFEAFIHRLLNLTAPDSCECGEKSKILLSVLFGEITNDRREALPYAGVEAKLRGCLPLSCDRRQLKEVPHEHYLQSSECIFIVPKRATDEVNETEQLTVEHRDLIDDKHLCSCKALDQCLSTLEFIEVLLA